MRCDNPISTLHPKQRPPVVQRGYTLARHGVRQRNWASPYTPPLDTQTCSSSASSNCVDVPSGKALQVLVTPSTAVPPEDALRHSSLSLFVGGRRGRRPPRNGPRFLLRATGSTQTYTAGGTRNGAYSMTKWNKSRCTPTW